jgi:ribosomal protein S18 acetylase RimI-like enzyme
MQVKRLSKLTTDQLLELEAKEKAVFGDGGLNRWTLPPIARYGFLFALFLDEEIAGLASFISKKNTAFLIGLWVDEKYRGQGRGRFLLAESISKLKKSGITQIELTVKEDNLSACKLYEKIGFKIIRRIEGFYGPSRPRLLLRRNLLQ